MSVALLRRFYGVLSTLGDRDYLLARVAFEAAPAFLGIKPAALMSFGAHDRNLRRLWEEYGPEVCSVLRLQFFELKKTGKHTLVLFYHAELLEGVLGSGESRLLLAGLGYEDGVTPARLLPLLRVKFEQGFPHEIGLLLGIPPRDVMGFMSNKGAGCLLCGYWKVYHDPRRAADLFRRYDRAKSRVLRRICSMGKPDSTSA